MFADISQSCRILVAESEAVLSMMLESVLRETGFEVVGPAATAKEALTLLGRESVDCAVMEIKLADGTSLAVAAALTERQIPFLIATSCDRRRIPAGYNGAPVLSKVYLDKELIEAVGCLLRPRSFVRAAMAGVLAAA